MTAVTNTTDFAGLGLSSPMPSGSTRGELGQQDFLTLMITQFKNQNPMEPMDNGDFLGQMAQFSTVSGITSLQKTMSGLAESLVSDQALQASGLVGRQVLVREDHAMLDESGLHGAVELPVSAGNLIVRVKGPNGALLREYSLGPQQAGTTSFSWDGITNEGDAAVPGSYTIEAEAQIDGHMQAVNTYALARVNSVNLGGGSLTLNLEGLGLHQFGDIKQISGG